MFNMKSMIIILLYVKDIFMSRNYEELLWKFFKRNMRAMLAK